MVGQKKRLLMTRRSHRKDMPAHRGFELSVMSYETGVDLAVDVAAVIFDRAFSRLSALKQHCLL